MQYCREMLLDPNLRRLLKLNNNLTQNNKLKISMKVKVYSSEMVMWLLVIHNIIRIILL